MRRFYEFNEWGELKIPPNTTPLLTPCAKWISEMFAATSKSQINAYTLSYNEPPPTFGGVRLSVLAVLPSLVPARSAYRASCVALRHL